MELSPKKRKGIVSALAKAWWRIGKELELNMSELGLLKQELFGNPGNAISDIKFYPGESREHSIEEIAASIRTAITSVRNGGGRAIDLSI